MLANVAAVAVVAHPLVVAVRPVVEALGATLVPASRRRPSDIPLVWEGEVVGAVRPPPLHGALERMVNDVEREMGQPLRQLSREDKQRVVQLLEDRGAFTLRRSVEEVAELLGVSRFTVYNYINRPREPGS